MVAAAPREATPPPRGAATPWAGATAGTGAAWPTNGRRTAGPQPCPTPAQSRRSRGAGGRAAPLGRCLGTPVTAAFHSPE